jgi:hypothetical protein
MWPDGPATPCQIAPRNRRIHVEVVAPEGHAFAGLLRLCGLPGARQDVIRRRGQVRQTYGCSSDRNRCNAREKPFSEMPNLMG